MSLWLNKITERFWAHCLACHDGMLLFQSLHICPQCCIKLKLWHRSRDCVTFKGPLNSFDFCPTFCSICWTTVKSFWTRLDFQLFQGNEPATGPKGAAKSNQTLSDLNTTFPLFTKSWIVPKLFKDVQFLFNRSPNLLNECQVEVETIQMGIKIFFRLSHDI